MKVKEVRKSLVTTGYEKLSHLDFKKRGDYIEKRVGEFYYFIGFGVVDLQDLFHSSFYFGIGSSAVLNILKEIYPNKDFKKEKYHVLYSNKQTRLFDEGLVDKPEYSIKNIDDVIYMIEEISGYYEEKIFPFLSSLNSLKKVSGFVNYDENVKQQSSYLPITLKTGLILARLTGDPYYSSLVNEYKDLIIEWPEFDKNDLEKVIRFLKNSTVEELKKIAGITEV